MHALIVVRLHPGVQVAAQCVEGAAVGPAYGAPAGYMGSMSIVLPARERQEVTARELRTVTDLSPMRSTGHFREVLQGTYDATRCDRHTCFDVQAPAAEVVYAIREPR